LHNENIDVTLLSEVNFTLKTVLKIKIIVST